MRPSVLPLMLLAFTASLLHAQAPSARLDTAMRALWDADSSSETDAAIRGILSTGASFDDIAARLRAGRQYSSRRTGTIEMRTVVDGLALDNVVEVPEEYTPARKWPVRVSLHGGVGREPPQNGERPRPLGNRTPIAGEIVIHPRAWNGVEWWRPAQVDNILRLLDRVKREYNVDEARVYVTGISDGGTGVFYLAMRAATPWAACLSLNGHPSVLANPSVGADGQLHAGTLASCPLYLVNGGRDRLYPADAVASLVAMLRDAGVPVQFQVYPEAGHDVSWWPEERPRFEAFLAAHPRVAHPEQISWETERTDRYNRLRWLVIERLGKRASDVALEDVNTVSTVSGRDLALYSRSRPSGRVDAARNGNALDLRTRGVHELTLLLSPDVIDFARLVRVTVNGRVVHDATVEKDGRTLLEWAARDTDRTMLYAAELTIIVP